MLVLIAQTWLVLTLAALLVFVVLVTVQRGLRVVSSALAGTGRVGEPARNDAQVA